VKPVCTTLSVSKRTIESGRQSLVVLTVKAAGKPVAGARLRLVGPGVSKIVVTTRKGQVHVRFKTTKPGIVRISVLKPHASCTTQLIGAVGTFQPPVTG